MTSDVDSLAELVQMGLLMFVRTPCCSSFSVVVLAVVSWQLLLVCLIPVPFVVRRQHQVPARLEPRLPRRARPHRPHAVALQEGIAGVRVIQAFGREAVEIDRFARRRTATSTTPTCDSVRIQAWYLPVIEFAGLGTTALVVGIGGWLVHRGRRHASAPSPSSC